MAGPFGTWGHKKGESSSSRRQDASPSSRGVVSEDKEFKGPVGSGVGILDEDGMHSPDPFSRQIPNKHLQTHPSNMSQAILVVKSASSPPFS